MFEQSWSATFPSETAAEASGRLKSLCDSVFAIGLVWIAGMSMWATSPTSTTPFFLPGVERRPLYKVAVLVLLRALSSDLDFLRVSFSSSSSADIASQSWLKSSLMPSVPCDIPVGGKNSFARGNFKRWLLFEPRLPECGVRGHLGFCLDFMEQVDKRILWLYLSTSLRLLLFLLISCLALFQSSLN